MRSTAATLRTTNLYSDELRCPSCIPKITARLEAVAGVEQATVHFTTGRIEVVHDGVPVEDLVAAVAAAGYGAAPRGF